MSKRTDFSQISYGILNNHNVEINVASIGIIMKQLHESSLRCPIDNPASDMMRQFSFEIGAKYQKMTRGEFDIYDKIVRGTILNGNQNNGILSKPVGKNTTYIHKIRFGRLMSTMLNRVDYILENFKYSHKSFPFKNQNLIIAYDKFYDELIDFYNFLLECCEEWKYLFVNSNTQDMSYDDSNTQDTTQ
jgi:hypothetical protein